mgnify:CR=1 FL=1
MACTADIPSAVLECVVLLSHTWRELKFLRVRGTAANKPKKANPYMLYDVGVCGPVFKPSSSQTLRAASLSVQTRAEPKTCCIAGRSDMCRDNGNDCCAPQGIGEAASCADGYVPVRFHLPCDRWPGWTNGKFKCCVQV